MFFDFLTFFITKFNEIEDKSQYNIDLTELVHKTFETLKQYQSTEKLGAWLVDKVLQGYLQTTTALLKIYLKTSSYDDLLAFEKKQGFLHEMFYEQLFYCSGFTKT